MNRTLWLEETKQMRFEEAYDNWQAKRLTQEEAAQLLGVCQRSFRRYINRYHEEGLQGLIDKRLHQVSYRQAQRSSSEAPGAVAPTRHADSPGWFDPSMDTRHFLGFDSDYG